MKRGVISIVIISLMIILSVIFYLLPSKSIELKESRTDNNFSSDGSDMQFYSNMRFQNKEITYKISGCNLKKQNEMEYAFEIMENLSALKFNPVEKDEQILVTCEEKAIIANGLFIAGEGGPTKIVDLGNLKVILRGEILLIKDSDCAKPNIAIHELLHVLGFEHSANSENIMYNITKCSQTIGEDQIQEIKRLYSIPVYPDLSFGNTTAVIKGRFIDINTTINNLGLKEAGSSEIKIYADDKLIKELPLGSINFGQGRVISLNNILITQIKIERIKIVIDASFNEIDKENNKIEFVLES